MGLHKKTINEEIKTDELRNLNFLKTINKFIDKQKIESTNVKSYYKNILINFHLFHNKEFQEIETTDCQKYIGYLKRVHRFKKRSEQVITRKLKLLASKSKISLIVISNTPFSTTSVLKPSLVIMEIPNKDITDLLKYIF